MDRPSVSEVEQIYNELFGVSTLDNLITSALYGRLFHDKHNQENVAGRSMIWKLFLCPQPPLTNNLSPHPVPPLAFLRDVRVHYTTLLGNAGLSHYHDNPDATASTRPMPSSSPNFSDWSLNNPLSLDSSNPWHAYFSAAETRKIIRQDVERTFPEIPYFRQTGIQNALTNILFLYTQGNGDIGYRQGMHELLACVYRVIDYDAVGDDCSNPQLQELCSSSYVAADAHALFGLIMKYMETWYEWQPSKGIPAVIETHALEPYVAPVIKACTSLRDDKLRSVDPYLWEKLQEGGIEPQIYGMRWLRLLFTREFTLGESMIIWDGLFASVAVEDTPSSSSSSHKNGFPFALWIGVAMLMRIRNYLITGNYTDQLTNVLRYPSIPPADNAKPSNVPALLLMQARSLMTYPNPNTGVSIMMQNRSEFGTTTHSREPSSPKQARELPPSTYGSKPHPHPQVLSGTSLFDKQGFPNKLHRILDGNDSLGIQRGFRDTLGAISDLRKNLPDISQALTRHSSWNGSSISLHNDISDDFTSGRNSGSEGEGIGNQRKIQPEHAAELRSMLKTLGGGMQWALDALLSDKETSQEAQDRKYKAVQCLDHIKAFLLDEGRREIDMRRLLDPDLQPEAPEHRYKDTSKESFPPPKPHRSMPSLAFPRRDNVTQRKPSSRPSPSLPSAVASGTDEAFVLPQSHMQPPVQIQSDPLGVLS